MVFCGSGGTVTVCDPEGAGAGVLAGAAEAEVSVLVVSTVGFLAFALWVVPAFGVAFWAWMRFRHADFEWALFSVLQ